MDTKKDGEISKEEFLMAVLPLELRELIFGGNWAGLFDKLDENGDGVLSLGEFMAQDEVRNSGGLMAALTEFEVPSNTLLYRFIASKPI